MSRTLLRCCLFWFAFAVTGSLAAQPSHPAVNEPDRFAWEIFSRINQPSNNGTNDTEWETWATDEETFPLTPVAGNPPRWPGRGPRRKTLVESRQLKIANQGRTRKLDIRPRIVDGGNQEVRRNQAAFDFIVAEGLWNRDGLIDAFNAGKSISFPVEAIEIKATWKPIAEGDKPRFHWNVDRTGTLFGLTGLHITTKDLPNWFWATFEHVDNPARGRDLGCHDRFGTTPPQDCSAPPSRAVQQLLAQSGLGAQWLNYRLAGSQTDFVDSTGRPTLLGNSEIEGFFMTTSSCVTCHAKAAIDGNGDFLPVFKSESPLEGDIGIPNPNWYYAVNGTRKVMQLDFVWGFAAAMPLRSGPRTTPRPATTSAREARTLPPGDAAHRKTPRERSAAPNDLAVKAAEVAIQAAGADDARLVQVFQATMQAALTAAEATATPEPQPTPADDAAPAAPAARRSPGARTLSFTVPAMENPILTKNRAAMIRDIRNRPRIVGGTLTTEFPDCVAVGSGGSWCCTGTLIAPNVVLTAGHCFEGCASRIFVGSNTGNTSAGTIYDVKEAIRHPDFDEDTLANDLTLLVLEEKVTGVTPCPIADSALIDAATDIHAVGFGTTNFGGTVGYGLKREVDLPIASALCDTASSSTLGCHVGLELVAGSLLLDRDTCRGDSGGPAYVRDGSVWKLAGATSRATNQAPRVCGDGGTYVRVDQYLVWIQSVIDDNR